ncbi:MAG: hypothetical protein PHQ52_03600 [Candidatus Omnitrophica bacterium]|nr:hypothetical protein [Candidatus Omnitrophota bacterium]
MRKNYITPKITSVYLDPKQASLQACAVGGLYIWTMTGDNTHCSSVLRTIGAGPNCNISVKGQGGVGMPMIYTLPASQAEVSIPS